MPFLVLPSVLAYTARDIEEAQLARVLVVDIRICPSGIVVFTLGGPPVRRPTS